MPTSDNHSYELPNRGDPNWDVPLNDNFEGIDTDIEIRDVATNRSTYTPKNGARFLATDTGLVSLGDGASWLPTLSLSRYTAPSTSGAAGSLVSGHSSNGIDGGVSGATVAGGGFDDGTDVRPNEVTADYGTVGGGQSNVADSEATVGGGRGNVADGGGATVGGGINNASTSTQTSVGGGNGNTASGGVATVAGGSNNEASGNQAAVGGGAGNAANGDHSTVAGGEANTASFTDATVGGGSSNTAQVFGTTVSGGSNNEASGGSATVGGGLSNVASGDEATVGGGSNNVASGGSATVNGGVSNTASGSWATADGGDSNTASGDAATVGGGFGNTASASSATVPGGNSNTANGAYSFAAGYRADANRKDGAVVFADGSTDAVAADAADQFVVQAGGGAKIYSASDLSTGVELVAGDGAWSSLSSRAAKTDLEPVDPTDVLDGLQNIDIGTWTYESQDESIRHMGPMAEDFHDEFGLGGDSERITTVDADGVALAAIQGLAAELEERDERIDEQREHIDGQRERIEELEAAVDRLHRHVGSERTDSTTSDPQPR